MVRDLITTSPCVISVCSFYVHMVFNITRDIPGVGLTDALLVYDFVLNYESEYVLYDMHSFAAFGRSFKM